MTDLRKAAEMALEALESFRLAQNPLVPQSIYVLRQALAQPEQCICHRCINEKDLREGAFPLSSTRMILCPECGNKRCPKASDHRLDCTGSNESGQEGSVYTAPPSKPWVSLTDEEIFTINHKAATDYEDGLTYARAIEATLRSKNT